MKRIIEVAIVMIVCIILATLYCLQRCDLQKQRDKIANLEKRISALTKDQKSLQGDQERMLKWYTNIRSDTDSLAERLGNLDKKLLKVEQPVELAEKLDDMMPGEIMAKAGQLFKQGDCRKALRYYQYVVKNFPGSEDADDAQLMIGINYDWLAAETGDIETWKKEVEAYKKLIKDYPDSSRTSDAYLYMGQSLSGFVPFRLSKELIDYEKAIDCYKKAIDRESERVWLKAQAQGRIGQCLDKLHRPQEAMLAYQKVLDEYPNSQWADEVKKVLEKRVQE